MSGDPKFLVSKRSKGLVLKHLVCNVGCVFVLFCLKLEHPILKLCRRKCCITPYERPEQEKALRVPRAVNMVNGLPRACKSNEQIFDHMKKIMAIITVSVKHVHKP